MKRWGVVCCGAVLLSGCAGLPQSRDDFRAALDPEEGQVFKYVIDRSYSSTLGGIRWGIKRCLSGTSARWAEVDGDMRKVTVSYNTALVPKRDGYSELTVQMQEAPPTMGEMPEGGYYLAAMDIQSLSVGRTRLTAYAYTPEIVESLRGWAAGEAPDECPSPMIK